MEDGRGIGLLQSLPERQEDVAWIDERRSVGDGKVEGKNADTFIGTDNPEAPTIWSLWYFYFDRDIRTCVSTLCAQLDFLFNST